MRTLNAIFYCSIFSQNSELEQCSPLIVLTETSIPSTSFLSPVSTCSAENFEEVLRLDDEEHRYLQENGASISSASSRNHGHEQTSHILDISGLATLENSERSSTKGSVIAKKEALDNAQFEVDSQSVATSRVEGVLDHQESRK